MIAAKFLVIKKDRSPPIGGLDGTELFMGICECIPTTYPARVPSFFSSFVAISDGLRSVEFSVDGGFAA